MASINYEKVAISNEKYIALTFSDKNYIIYPNLEYYKIIPNNVSKDAVSIQLKNINQSLNEIIGPKVKNIILEKNVNDTTFDYINNSNLDVNIYVHYKNIDKINSQKKIYVYHNEDDVTEFYNEEKYRKKMLSIEESIKNYKNGKMISIGPVGPMGVDGPIILTDHLFDKTKNNLQLHIINNLPKKYLYCEDFEKGLLNIYYSNIKMNDDIVFNSQKKQIEELKEENNKLLNKISEINTLLKI